MFDRDFLAATSRSHRGHGVAAMNAGEPGSHEPIMAMISVNGYPLAIQHSPFVVDLPMKTGDFP